MFFKRSSVFLRITFFGKYTPFCHQNKLKVARFPLFKRSLQLVTELLCFGTTKNSCFVILLLRQPSSSSIKPIKLGAVLVFFPSFFCSFQTEWVFVCVCVSRDKIYQSQKSQGFHDVILFSLLFPFLYLFSDVSSQKQNYNT